MMQETELFLLVLLVVFTLFLHLVLPSLGSANHRETRRRESHGHDRGLTDNEKDSEPRSAREEAAATSSNRR